jgi:SAM-dependent methyltransferase
VYVSILAAAVASIGPMEHANYRWVGVNYSDQRAPILADGHALPFFDNTFDLVLSLAVLEHIRYPHVAMREVNRVLRPGGVFFRSVTYLTPFHLASFYNMTHFGTYSVLQHAGFHVEKVASDSRYWESGRSPSEGFSSALPAVSHTRRSCHCLLCTACGGFSPGSDGLSGFTKLSDCC